MASTMGQAEVVQGMNSMGQLEVNEFLKDNPKKWVTSREISLVLKISTGSISYSLRKLMMKGEVERRKDPNFSNAYQYRFKE